MKMDSDFEWFRLSRVKGIGQKALWGIYDYMLTVSATLRDLLSDSNLDIPTPFKKFKGNLSSMIAAQDYDKIVGEFERLINKRTKILHPEDESFPLPVLNYGREFDIPPVLFSRGHLPLANARSVSIVGSRNLENEGLELSQHIARDLAKIGFNVVSGYAKGVDSYAHMGSLEAEGTTTIVLSLGILNFELKKEFKPLVNSSNTLVLSQFSPTERWLARNAMARNKLVCALSRALVVVASGKQFDEHGRMSGTFEAAKSALAMNIPVFVISPNYFAAPPAGNIELIKCGCHELLSDKAAAQIASIVGNGFEYLDQRKTENNLEEQLALFIE